MQLQSHILDNRAATVADYLRHNLRGANAFNLVLNQIRIGRDRGDGVCVWRLGQ